MKWFILLITLGSFLFSSSILADDDNHRFPMDLHDLKLSPQQQQSVQAAMREYQQSYRTYHRQQRAVQENLKWLFLSPTFNEDAYRTQYLQLERTSIEIQSRLLSRLHQILTTEQKQRFVRHMQEWEIE